MAEEVVAKASDVVIGGCINLIKHHFNYLSQYHHHMKNLDINLKKLESKRTEVQDEVFNATDKGVTIRADVNEWLGEVAGKVEEAEKILMDKEKVGNGCWKRWFVNLKPRYSLSKKAMKKSGDLDKFLARGVFASVAHPKRPLAHVFDSVGASSSKKMKNDTNHQVLEVQGNEESKEGTTSNLPAAGADGGLTSRSLLLNDVMRAVTDPNIRIIRICGMGGIGKTTVAKQVEQKARAERLFHEIAMVEVNQKPISVLQLHIAERFDLKLEEDDVPARAVRLCERLNAKDQNGQSKRILLILDNVWKKEDLEQVGIPLIEKKSLCKILLTSRSDLVCKDIAPEPEFNIGVLPHPENLNLFRQCIPSESFYDQKMAEELVKECGGLPISITAIAGAVRYGKQEIWADALTKLRKSEFTGEYAQVLNSIKVSYDFLEDEEIKSFFRLLCFFRKGSDVPIEELARYGMAFGCFTDPEKLYEARNEAHSYANKLLHSNLLLRGDEEGCFKVHDIVWDFAVQAPSNDLFIINHGDALIKSKRKEPNQNYTSISLQCSKMVEVPKGVDVLNLKFLQLIGNFELIGNSDTLPLEFPNNFFEKMKQLNVLAFRSLKVTPLPKSLQHLNNLWSLSFDRCSIGRDISMIGNLVKLELLSFAYSDIEELPVQIGNLKELRLLDMTGCWSLRVIAEDVLSELSSLEELYMRGTPLELGTGSPTIYSEIASMSKLVVLDIVVPFHEVLPMDSLFSKLNNFKISVTTSQRGEDDGYILENYLDLECDSIVLQQPGVKLLLQKTVRMDLKVTNLENLFPLYNSEEVKFSNLQKLSIESCNEMVYLVSLGLYGSNETDVAPFCNLKVLNVESCDELEHLFSSSDARSLNSLEVIEVRNCNKLKVVLGKGRRSEEKVELRKLKKMTLVKLPNLVGFCSDVEAPEFPQLEELKIWDLPLITSIIHPDIGPFDSSHRDDSSSHPLFSYKSIDHTSPALVTLEGNVCPWPWSFHKLKTIEVKSCNNLQYIFSSSTAKSLEQLTRLRVGGCKMMTEVIREDEEVDGRIKIVFHSLESLYFDNLPNLQGICLGMLSFDWPLLRSLNIIYCLKVRIFTSGYSTTPLLEDLCVNEESYNPMMEEGDLNTVLRNAQIKVANLALKEEGTLETFDFQLAGDHLIAHYSTWSWRESNFFINMIRAFKSHFSGRPRNTFSEKYLIARNVPCLRRPRNTSTSHLVLEKQDQDQNEVDPAGDDEMNIYKPRTYDVSITYDQTYKSTRLWVKGYDESNMDLPLDLVFQDINMKYLEESHVTRGNHPCTYETYVSLFPREESRRFAKVLFENLRKNGLNPNVQNHLQLFVDELFPTFQFGPAR